MIASANGHTQVVELLSKELVDIDVQKKVGSTALTLIYHYGHVGGDQYHHTQQSMHF